MLPFTSGFNVRTIYRNSFNLHPSEISAQSFLFLSSNTNWVTSFVGIAIAVKTEAYHLICLPAATAKHKNGTVLVYRAQKIENHRLSLIW